MLGVAAALASLAFAAAAPAQDAEPVFSPDGTTIAYVHIVAGRRTLFLIGASGANARATRAGGRGELRPVWSTDGAFIVFQAGGGLQRLDVRSGAVTIIARSAHAPSFSPDGGALAFLTRAGLSIAHSDGSAAPLAAPGAETEAAWSPDGSRVASGRGRGLFAIGTDGRGERRLVGGLNARALSPRWSPDGARIVFRAGGRILVVGSDGAGLGAVAQAPAVGPPAFAPDSHKIAFTRPDGVVVVDGAGIAHLPPFRFGAAPPALAWAPNGSELVFAAAKGACPNRRGVYVATADFTGTAMLTNDCRPG